jgi:NADH:ubiquinone oxidoreductase subunit 2 (chain N)
LDLAIYAVMTSLIGAFFYLRIVKVMFFDEPVRVHPTPVVCQVQRWLLSVNGLTVLALGIFPGPLLVWCVTAVRLSLGT